MNSKKSLLVAYHEFLLCFRHFESEEAVVIYYVEGKELTQRQQKLLKYLMKYGYARRVINTIEVAPWLVIFQRDNNSL